MERAVRMLKTQASDILIIKGVPIALAPCPIDNKQLVATINPTPVAITLPNPSFFSLVGIESPICF
jgi:hypothetical protein